MLAELVQRHADEHPDAVLVRDPDEVLTNAAFDHQARALAAWLLDRHVQPADRVVLCAHNSARWLVSNVALIGAGALMAPATYRTTPEELAYLVNYSGARGAIVDAAAARHLAATSPEDVPGLEWVVAIDDEVVPIDGVTTVTWAEATATAPLPRPLDEPGGSMIFTSGTTGRPKGVYRPPSRASSGSMGAFLPLFDLRPGDVYLCAGPLYHGGPHAFAILALALGGEIVVLPKFEPEACLAAIEQHRVTTTFMVPTMLRLFTKHEATRDRRYDTSSLRVLVTAGEPCPMPLKRDVAELLGPVLYEFFGATELGINAVMTPEGHARKPGSCGQVLPGQQFVVLGFDGEPVPPGVEGELAVGNDTLPEYWKDADATEAARRGQLMSLGDTGYVDEDGYLFVTGRTVDLIKTGGVRVTPGEIEAVLLEHPAVLEAAVVGVPDDIWSERIAACIVPVDSVDGLVPTEAEIQDWCRARLPSHKVPKQVVWFTAAEWPRLENGKVPKRLLRDLLTKQASSA